MKSFCKSLLLLILISPFQLSSQNFIKGFIITSQNDTIRGFIEENTEDALTNVLYFSTDEHAVQLTKYVTSELNGFGLNDGRKFKKFKLKEFNGTDSIDRIIFAKPVLNGKISVYMFKGATKDDEYLLINNQTGKKVHLQKPKEKSVQTEDGKTLVTSDYKYLQYLTIIKQDDPNAFVKQDNIKYGKSEIVKNIKKYNKSYIDKFPVYQYMAQKQVSYSVLAGYHPFFNTDDISNHYRISIFRETKTTENTWKASFIQGITYSQFSQDYDKKALNQILSIFPIGIKIQTKPMVVTPYFYVGLGATLVSEPIRYWEDPVIHKEISPAFAAPIGAGVRIKATPQWYILTEVTGKLILEGIFLNAGISYQFNK